jgi:hypothetical protein
MQESHAAAHKPLAKFAILGCEVTQPTPGTKHKPQRGPTLEGGLKRKKGRSGERTAQV